MKVSLWVARNLIKASKVCDGHPGTQPTPSEIIAGAITRENNLTTTDFTGLKNSSYLRKLDQRFGKFEYNQWLQYHTSINTLREIDESYNAAAKFAIAFCTLLETDLITDGKLDLFVETFLYIEKNGLPVDKYTATFITLIEDRATYEELSLFAHSAVSLIQSDEPIDELVTNMDFVMSMHSTRNEKRDLIASYCAQATQHLRKKYETTVNKVARYFTYIPKTAAGAIGKIALGIFG